MQLLLLDTSPFIREYYAHTWALNPGGLAQQDPAAQRQAIQAWLQATATPADANTSGHSFTVPSLSRQQAGMVRPGPVGSKGAAGGAAGSVMTAPAQQGSSAHSRQAGQTTSPAGTQTDTDTETVASSTTRPPAAAQAAVPAQTSVLAVSSAPQTAVSTTLPAVSSAQGPSSAAAPAAPGDASQPSQQQQQQQQPWRIVIGHHPLASHGSDSSKKESEQEDMAWLKDLLLQQGVPLYFNGHEHCLELISKAGPQGALHMVTSGAGSDVEPLIGFSKEVHYQAADQGFVAVRVFSQYVLLEFYVAHGAFGTEAPDYAIAVPRPA